MIKLKKPSNYKIFKKVFYSLNFFPKRLLKFKKEKWFKLQQTLKKRIKYSRKINYKKKKYKKKRWKKKQYKVVIEKNIFGKKIKRARLQNIFQKAVIKSSGRTIYKKRGVKILIRASRFLKLKNIKKSHLNTKKLFRVMFNTKINKNYFKKDFKIKFYLLKKTVFLLKPYFRQDVLMWSTNFFNSVAEARQFKNQRKLLLNKKLQGKSFKFLVKGDILEVNKHYYSLRVLRNKYFSGHKKFFTFVEIDYYTNAIVIVKNLKELSLEDFPLLIQEPITTRRLEHCY